MSNGIDYSQGYNIADIKASGVSFVCRYIGWTDTSLPQDKIIVYSEAYDLLNTGLSIVSNWEWTADRASLNNSFYNGNHSAAFAGGVSDAQMSSKLHTSIGGPPDRPIYFSIDYSTDGEDCIDYFNGLKSVLGLGRVGAYGPPNALKMLKSKGLINWMWGWTPDASMNIQQVSRGVRIGSMTVDTDSSLTVDFGQWGVPSHLLSTLPKPQWFQYPVGVPPLNTNYDVGLGGSHDETVLCPPNMPVTSIVSGTVSDLSAPSWGKQVGIKLDNPVNGKPYFAHLHLSALNPSLSIGQHVNKGNLLGWAGGANEESQYLGTSNPTGQNFLNSPDMSSRVQVGIALMDGPSYGGSGWENFPPLDINLDPSNVLLQARIDNSPGSVTVNPPTSNNIQTQFNAVWKSSPYGVKWFGSGLYNARLQATLSGKLSSCFPIEDEQTQSLDTPPVQIVDYNGRTIIWQQYSDGSHGEWDRLVGGARIYDANGNRVL